MQLNALNQFMEKNKVSFILLTNNSEKPNKNFTYLTQIDQINGALILKDKPVLYASPLEFSIAEKYSKIKNIKLLKKDFFSVLKKLKPEIIGIDQNYVSLNKFNNLKLKLKKSKFKDVSNFFLEQRLIKTEYELELIKKSCKFADLLMEKAMNFAEKVKTELELVKFIEKELIDLNLRPAFSPIVASGKNSKNPHHISDNTKLKGFTIIDLGVNYKNYCSDTTRTIFVGNPDKKHKLLYNKVLEAQENSIRDDLSPRELHNKAQKILGKYLIHNLGHGIGLDVHELPVISSSSRDSFKDNNVFALEPAYYNQFGIRIEDVFLYKNKKKIPLTKSPKNLLII